MAPERLVLPCATTTGSVFEGRTTTVFIIIGFIITALVVVLIVLSMRASKLTEELETVEMKSRRSERSDLTNSRPRDRSLSSSPSWAVTT